MNNSSLPARHWLGLAAGLELSFLLLAYLSGGFTHGESHEERPIVAVIAILMAASGLWLVAVVAVFRSRPPPVWLVLVSAVVFRLTLIPAPPIQEDDFYRYLWDGRVVEAGLDPYRFSPRQIEVADFEPEIFPARDRPALEALNALRGATESQESIFERINHPRHGTVYPLVSQGFFGLVASVTPPYWSVDSQIAALKAAVALLDLLAVVFTMLILRTLRMPPSLALVHAWCPLAVKEFAGTGHVDVLAMALCSLTALAALRGRATLTGFALAAAILAKLYALATLPLVLLLLFRGCRARSAAPWRGVLVSTLVTAALIGASQCLYPESRSSRWENILEFASTWEKHDAIYLWTLTFVDACYRSWHPSLAALADVGPILARAAVAGLLAVFVLGHVMAELRNPQEPAASLETPRRLLWRIFAVLGAMVLLSPVGFPWYFGWCLPFLPFARNRAWFVLPGLLPIYYLGFWFEYRSDGAGTQFFDTWIVSLEFGLFFLLWFVDELLKQRRSRRR